MKQLLIIMALLFSFGKNNAQTGKQFKEADDTPVFTTKFVVKDKKTISYVTHDADDGAWQFFSDDEITDYEKVAMLVSLKQITELDPTLLQLADMPVGHYASRKNKKDKWQISKTK